MRKLILSGVLAMSMVAPAFADTTTLKGALEATYKNNPGLARVRTSLKNLDEAVVQALAGLKPTVSASLRSTITDPINQTESSRDSYSNTASLTISQLLYDGGQTAGRVESSKLALFAGREDLIATEQAALLQAITAFMDVRQAQATLNLAENNISVLREQLRASEDRFEVGEVTRTDVSQTQARLASAISNSEAARANVSSTIATYISVVGAKPHRIETPPAHPKVPPTLAQAEAIAVERHPRIRSAKLSLKAAGIDYQVARKNRIPTVTGSVTASKSGSSGILDYTNNTNTNVSVAVEATIRLYQGGALNSRQRAAANAKKADQYSLDEAIITTRLNLRRNYANWKSAVAAITASQAQIRAARVAFEGVREEAKLGSRTTLDVLDAEQEVLSARSSLISAVRDEQVQAYNVLSEMGLLTAKSLRLNVELYDPKANYNRVITESPLGSKRINLLEKLTKRRKNP